ncbi:MAG: hypothetical protein DRR19_02825 [Candidatus Parabeggiatoa sp. nov. 1]|nr:MAG: hypothetical protein DRR19_02825 [Gammaproteobacteria bacterium]
MDTLMLSHQQLTQAINELPTEVLPELANFIEYLRFKLTNSHNASEAKTQNSAAGSPFLLAIAGIGASDEDDISERDEEILANEIDPIHGWSLKRDNFQYPPII